MSNEQAGELLGLSQRQIQRLKKGLKEKGTDALKHGNRGKQPINAINDKWKEKIVELYLTKYSKANFQHFRDLLEELEGIKVGVTTVKRVLQQAGIRSSKKRKKAKVHRRRERKGHAGEMVQVDATPHDFFGTGEKVCLHGVIDDATGNINGLYMTKHECLDGYYSVFEQMIENFGVPASMYADRHTIFASPAAERMSIEDELSGVSIRETQLGRAMRELGITLIYARSPQAKGRIERLWGTLQDRLFVEFTVHGIVTLEAANAFLPGFIKRYNKRFGVVASEETILFVPNIQDLISVLCVRETRTIDPGGAFSFYGKTFVVDTNLRAGTKIEVIVHRKYGIFVLYNGTRLNVIRIEKPKKNKSKPTTKEQTVRMVPDSHYYKQGKASFVQYSNEYNDTEVLAIIRNIFDKNFKGNAMTLRKGGVIT